MIIIGIDPGTTHMGFGIIEKVSGPTQKNKPLKCIDYGLIQTTADSSQAEHLREINNSFNRLVRKYHPEYLAIEKIYFFKNAKTIISVSEARGVILLAAVRKKIKIIELTPLQVKTGICGYGRAPKQQIQKMVKHLLNLKSIPKPDDAADALALALHSAAFINSSPVKKLG